MSRSDMFYFLRYLSLPCGKNLGAIQKIAENRVFTAVITTWVLCEYIERKQKNIVRLYYYYVFIRNALGFITKLENLLPLC